MNAPKISRFGLEAFVTTSVLIVLWGVRTGAVDFARYQVILDRKPFGEVQPVKEVSQPVVSPPSAQAKTLRLCAITEDRDGRIQVGILDIAAKPPRSYFLSVGESQDGLEVVDAGYEEEKAVVRRSGEEFTLYLEGASTSGQSTSSIVPTLPSAARVISSPASVSTYAAPGTAVHFTPRSGDSSSSSSLGSASAQGTMSYAERLRARREALRHRTVEPPKLSGEELKKHLEEYQMELIRAKGAMGPPLPIQLTPEMDAQLVKEGVLPPNQ